MADEPEPNPKLDLLVKMARQMKVCRMCAKPDGGPLTLNFGKEYAHTACLSSTGQHSQKAEIIERCSERLIELALRYKADGEKTAAATLEYAADDITRNV